MAGPAAPLLAIPMLGKALGFGKIMLGGKKALAAAKAAGHLGRGTMANAMKARRFAGGLIGKTPGDIGLRVGPDIAFGIMGGAMTPGDLGDKIIAGGAQAAGGLVGGIGAGGIAKKLGAPNAGVLLADQVGSIAGDFASIPVADAAMRIKGGGTTPYEKQAAQADAAYRQQIEQELMAKYGLGGNPVLAANGLI